MCLLFRFSLVCHENNNAFDIYWRNTDKLITFGLAFSNVLLTLHLANRNVHTLQTFCLMLFPADLECCIHLAKTFIHFTSSTQCVCKGVCVHGCDAPLWRSMTMFPTVAPSPSSVAQPFTSNVAVSQTKPRTELQPGENICTECGRLIV